MEKINQIRSDLEKASTHALHVLCDYIGIPKFEEREKVLSDLMQYFEEQENNLDDISQKLQELLNSDESINTPSTEWEDWAMQFQEAHNQQVSKVIPYTFSDKGLLNKPSTYLSAKNPFITSSDVFVMGKKLFLEGNISDSILAFEAEVQINPSNVEGWLQLGIAQAENENDKKAISAFQEIVTKLEPMNSAALLALAVSLENELERFYYFIFFI